MLTSISFVKSLVISNHLTFLSHQPRLFCYMSLLWTLVCFKDSIVKQGKDYSITWQYRIHSLTSTLAWFLSPTRNIKNIYVHIYLFIFIYLVIYLIICTKSKKTLCLFFFALFSLHLLSLMVQLPSRFSSKKLVTALIFFFSSSHTQPSYLFSVVVAISLLFSSIDHFYIRFVMVTIFQMKPHYVPNTMSIWYIFLCEIV